MTTRSPPASFRVQKFLSGLRYPAAKPEILARARARGADEEALRALGGLPEREYASPIALSCAVGRIARR
jgi:hypothetical protein